MDNLMQLFYFGEDMVSITAGLVTTNERSVFELWTNGRTERPVSVSRSHQDQRPPCEVCGLSEAGFTQPRPMEAAACKSPHCRVHTVDRKADEEMRCITCFCFYRVKQWTHSPWIIFLWKSLVWNNYFSAGRNFQRSKNQANPVSLSIIFINNKTTYFLN